MMPVGSRSRPDPQYDASYQEKDPKQCDERPDDHPLSLLKGLSIRSSLGGSEMGASRETACVVADAR
ncbi:MAG TPA: hypothetical protein VFJ27_09585 [Terriglobia bacterium]|nr:hypothetical protein [Terriglobia bacterium]